MTESDTTKKRLLDRAQRLRSMVYKDELPGFIIVRQKRLLDEAFDEWARRRASAGEDMTEPKRTP